MTDNVSLNQETLRYVRMRLAQIASGDYKACGLSAEEIARDAIAAIQTIPVSINSQEKSIQTFMGEDCSVVTDDTVQMVAEKPEISTTTSPATPSTLKDFRKIFEEKAQKIGFSLEYEEGSKPIIFYKSRDTARAWDFFQCGWNAKEIANG